jgi:2-polyprenyl-6-methoxyphenol hydroxylase-like FAD-dependent oxidoreductase
MTLRNPSEPMRSIDRLTLRQVLLRGVQERVHFNRVFTGYNQHSDHVTLHFSDGSTVDADVLVGADGNQSRVRSLLLPEHAELRDTGYRDLAGKVRLTAEARHLMAALKIASISMVTTVDGPTMVLIPQEFADSSQDYLYWGLVAKRDRYAELGKPDPTEPEHLRKTALNITSTWDERFRQLIGLTPAGALKLLVFRSSVPHGPWVSGRVTLLGDAVHSMVPMRGEGANTAVRDASALADSLAAAGGREVVQAAVAPYEREMLIYGFGKVRESLSSLELFVGGSRSKRIVLRTVLRSVQRGRTLFRRTASSSRALH